MNQRPHISFIVPVYNSAKYLEQCLQSILQQNIDKEIIIIDDGSTDDSLTMMLSYAKQHDFISVIHSQNQGLSAARNKGIRLAKGDYLFFVDSDDYLLGDYLSDIYSLASQNQIDVVKMQTELFLDHDPSQTYLWATASQNLSGQSAMHYTGRQFFVQLSHTRWIPCVCWSLIKREFLLKHQLFFTEGIKAEDQIFYTLLLTIDDQLKLLELPTVIYRYRQRKNSITTNTNDTAYLHDIANIITWLEQYQQANDFNDLTNQGLLRVRQFLYENIKQHFELLTPDLQNQHQHLLDNPPQ